MGTKAWVRGGSSGSINPLWMPIGASGAMRPSLGNASSCTHVAALHYHGEHAQEAYKANGRGSSAAICTCPCGLCTLPEVKALHARYTQCFC